MPDSRPADDPITVWDRYLAEAATGRRMLIGVACLTGLIFAVWIAVLWVAGGISLGDAALWVLFGGLLWKVLDGSDLARRFLVAVYLTLGAAGLKSAWRAHVGGEPLVTANFVSVGLVGLGSAAAMISPWVKTYQAVRRVNRRHADDG